jgi:cyanophycinase
MAQIGNRRSLICIATLVLILTVAVSVVSQHRLFLAGGGKRPPEAVKRFVEWAGREKARILVITWASGIPEGSFDGISKDFAAHKPAKIENAPIAPLEAAERTKFLDQLKTATAVFFTGGDQNRIMDVLKDEELLRLIREKYNSGTPFGGTSAGTAAMSDPMMTGEADLKIINGSKVGVRNGMGLLPGAILDQHFILRQRHNRLFGLVLENPDKLGIGIDEDTALLVENNRLAEVAGDTQVMFVDGTHRDGALVIYVLASGEQFDLRNRKPVKRSRTAVGH